MIPTEGRIVRFVDKSGDFTYEYAAIIHRVHSDTCVNLTIFTDTGPQTKTSVALDAGTDGKYRPFTWHWPVVGPRE